MKSNGEKFLIIRFSSFGDIVQGLRIPTSIKKKYPHAEVHWLVKENFASLVSNHPKIDRCFIFPKKGGLFSLFSYLWKLHKENYSHIYDAHNNVRSLIIYWGLYFLNFYKKIRFLKRPKNRLKRLLLFNFHINLFENWSFIGQKSFLEPLKKWGIEDYAFGEKAFFLTQEAETFAKEEVAKDKPSIAVMASANWPLKRWPMEYWKKLLEKTEARKYHWYFLGGEEDLFIDDLVKDYDFVKNYRGKTNLQESCAIINESDLLISNDTGLLHVADQLEKQGIAFIGPSAFGYPLSKNISVLEVDLYCKPCSKDGSGRCINKVYQKCLKSIEPDKVMTKICETLG